MHDGIAQRRLRNQRITAPRGGVVQVVAWLGAVQAQEYAFAKWALGLRMPDRATDALVERAFADGRILRTHVMRPTWHFVARDDIRWLLELTAPHVQRTMRTYDRQLGLDAAIMSRAIRVLERELRDGRYLTRGELGERLLRAGIAARGPRLAHLMMNAELERVICSGPRRGKQFTYALLAERAPDARGLPRDEALGELTRRFVTSHGPATARDLAWWSGLKAADARRGLEICKARPEEIDGRTYWSFGRGRSTDDPPQGVHLLPIYDEYLVAYRDRVAVPHAPPAAPGGGGFVTFQHALVAAGQVAGTWRIATGADGVAVTVTPLRRLTRAERAALPGAAAHLGRFLGSPVSVTVAPGHARAG